MPDASEASGQRTANGEDDNGSSNAIADLAQGLDRPWELCYSTNTMYIRVDPRSSTPLYGQIKREIQQAISMGALQPGDQLPRVRELAVDLRVNPNTVARAYRELQAEGLVTARQGSGTFVSDTAAEVSRDQQREALQTMVDDVAHAAANLGVSAEEFVQMAEDAARGTGKANRGDAEGAEDSNDKGKQTKGGR